MARDFGLNHLAGKAARPRGLVKSEERPWIS